MHDHTSSYYYCQKKYSILPPACNRFEFSHILSPPATLASHFLHDMLVDQLYAKEVYFCSFVTKCNQALTKYSPDVFISFYRTITYGEFFHKPHKIFTSPPPTLNHQPPPSNVVSPHFSVEPFPSVASHFFIKTVQVPLKRYNISIAPCKLLLILFFHLWQNSLFRASFFPHTGTPP